MPFLGPDLFLLSISKPVMGLLPSKPMVQRRAIVLSFTSLISTSGGSGGSIKHKFDKQCYCGKMPVCYNLQLVWRLKASVSAFFSLWAVEAVAVVPCTVSCMIPLSSPKELMAWQEKKPESSLTVGMIWWMHRNEMDLAIHWCKR